MTTPAETESSIHEQLRRLEGLTSQFDDVHESLRSAYDDVMREINEAPEVVMERPPQKSTVGGAQRDFGDKIEAFLNRIQAITAASDL